MEISYKMVIDIQNEQILNSLQICDALQLNGKYTQAINILQNIINTKTLTLNQQSQVKLKLQSLYYNSDSVIQAQNLVQQYLSIQLLQGKDIYYQCRFLLAYGSILYKTLSQDIIMVCKKVLQIYYKARCLYNDGVSNNDSRFIYNIQLKVKLYMNILLMLVMQPQSQCATVNQQANNKDLYQNKKFTNTKLKVITVDDKNYVIDKNMTTFIDNLQQIKTDIYLLDNKQIIDYYDNFYIILLAHLIQNHIVYNVTNVYYNNKIQTLIQILQKTIDKIYSMQIDKMSYRNKQTNVSVTYNVFNTFQIITQKIMSAYCILKQCGLNQYFKERFLLQIQYIKNNMFDFSQLYNYDFNIVQQDLFGISVETNDYIFKTYSDQRKIQIIQLFVQKFKMYNIYYKIVHMLNTKIHNGIGKQFLQQNVISNNQIKYFQSVILLYNNMFNYFEDKCKLYDHVNGLQQNLGKIINANNLLSILNYNKQLVNIYASYIQLLKFYHLYNNNIGQFMVLHYRQKNIQYVKRQKQSIKLYDQILQNSKTLDVKMNYIKELQQSNQILQNFAYILAHDLKTPLRSILNFSQLLQLQNRQQLNDLGQQSVSMVINYTKKMINLIQSSLQYAQIHRKLNKTQFNLKQVIFNIIQQYSQKITSNNICISVTDNLPQNVYGDKTLIGTVIINLLSNAIKSCNKNQSTIQIGLHNQNWIYVKDNGRGMNKQQQQNMFKLFFKGTSQQSDGTGIGLAIVKRILQKHDSHIIVQSVQGIGTTMYFSISVIKKK